MAIIDSSETTLILQLHSPLPYLMFLNNDVDFLFQLNQCLKLYYKSLV